MSVLRDLRKLLLGETWRLPGGLVATVAVALLARAVLGDLWRDAGGFVLLAGVSVVLVWSVAAGGRPARPARRRPSWPRRARPPGR